MNGAPSPEGGGALHATKCDWPLARAVLPSAFKRRLGREPMSRLDRREFVAALAAVPILASCARAVPAEAQVSAGSYNTRPLRPAGEVPVVGIGTARLYQNPQSEADYAPLRATMARFAELGGKVIDTAPSYG